MRSSTGAKPPFDDGPVDTSSSRSRSSGCTTSRTGIARNSTAVHPSSSTSLSATARVGTDHSPDVQSSTTARADHCASAADTVQRPCTRTGRSQPVPSSHLLMAVLPQRPATPPLRSPGTYTPGCMVRPSDTSATAHAARRRSRSVTPMRAVLVDPEAKQLVVDEVPDPEPEPGQLLVRVAAAGVNRADLAVT